MKAIVYHEYGARDVLALEEVPEPAAPESGDVLVRVEASSINPVDGKVRRGELKLIAGGRFPKRPGLDFSGVVEAVGEGVSGFAPGDAVFGAARGMSEGALAERVFVHAKSIARKPRSLDHDGAASVPTVAIAALQALRDIAHVKAGDRILVNGCTGGVGLYALQLARASGAVVTGVCSRAGMELARSFGADEVIDYKSGTPARDRPFRAILELSGRLDFEAAKELLEDGGVHVDFSPSPAALIGNAIANPFRHRKHVVAMTSAKTADLEQLATMLDAGTLRPTPMQVYPIERFAEAFERAESGGVIGKVVIHVAAGN